ncbi:MAG: peptide transporter, ATP-binding component [Actinomycetia bacterium]|nr:peptide transporter, ATP-binding component [Actinomycetes bacterium]
MTSTRELWSQDIILSVDDLSTWFPTPFGAVHAVDGVSLHLASGEIVGIVGESGSGKSVLARSIMKLTPESAITRGEVTFAGRALTTVSPAEGRAIWGKEIAMIFQNPMTSLNPVMKIGKQITESLKLHLRLNTADARRRAIELLALVGIPEPAARIKAYPYELSGGMRQRVCIAMAIACAPRLLLADEPTTALDVTIQRQILDLLADLCSDTHMAMILITHDLGVVARRTDRVMVMYGGRVVETAPTVKLFVRHFHPYTAALLSAIPRLHRPSHTRLAAIPGRPIDIIDPKPGCRFAPRCERAQPRCTNEDPPLTPASDDAAHLFACFYPVGTSQGDEALRANRLVGRNAAGMAMPVVSNGLAEPLDA